MLLEAQARLEGLLVDLEEEVEVDLFLFVIIIFLYTADRYILHYDCHCLYLRHVPTTCTLDTLRTLRRPFVRPRPVLRNLRVRRRRR